MNGAPAKRIPGNKGIWVGISCEFLEFSLLFTVYFVARLHDHAAFVAGGETLSRTAGTLITLLMISSSYALARAVHAIRANQARQTMGWLLVALFLALGYPVTKWQEIQWNLAHGIHAEASLFYAVYYYLTFTHLVHAMWGILGMLWVIARHGWGAYQAEDYSGLEALASYWHATDLIWLVIFSFFYVLA